MKRRSAIIICILALCLTTLSFPARAENAPYFIALNNTLLNLEDQFMPIGVNGQYYIPYTVLDSNSTGVQLGVHAIYNASLNTLTVYTVEKSLTFSLPSATCIDRNGNSYSSGAVSRNGRIYVPAQLVATYFGLTFSTRFTTYGPLVRICNSNSVLDDTTFVSNAQDMMESRLNEWRRLHPSDEPVVPTPRPTATPNAAAADISVYLAFRADQTDGLDEVLALLDQYQVSALFFFPATDIASYDDAVRRVLCGGHVVGLLTSGTTSGEIIAQAEEGNRLLAQIAYLDTYIVLDSDATPADVVEEVEANGFLYFHANVDAISNGANVYYQADTILRNVGRNEKAYIISDTSAVSSNLMSPLLSRLARGHYDIRLAVETELS